MAMLDESNLLAMRARAAKFRTNHVGTKLNEAELHEFEALAEKRKQTPSELIRGLVLGKYGDTIPIACWMFERARMARVVVPGVPNHVTQHGNRREAIFFRDGDHEIYKDLLAEQAEKN